MKRRRQIDLLNKTAFPKQLLNGTTFVYWDQFKRDLSILKGITSFL